MTLEFNWCAPVSGDGHQLGLPAWERPPSLEGSIAIFQAAERNGFRYLLVGMGFDNHVLEAWTLATAVLARTERIGAMIAVRPGFFNTAVLAKMVTTLDHLTGGGRVSLNVVSGGRPREQAMFGDFVEHDARYRRTAEFMEAARRLWTELEPFNYAGEFHDLRQTRLERLPLTPEGPPFYFGGASPIAERVAADHADVYLLWGETLAQTKERIAKMSFLLAQNGRLGMVRFGVRINVIARPTETEALEAARHLIAPIPLKKLENARNRELTNTERDSVGQKRQWDLLRQADDDLFIEPHLWTGIAVVRSGAGMAIVGSYQQVADRLQAYADLGVSVFILSGYPHLEECENVGKNVIPLLR